MREVTIHLAPGETDRELERALLALDPRAQVHRVSGRHGRTGVRVEACLALRYLAAVDTLEQVGLVTEGAVTTTSAVAEVAVTGVPDAAVTVGTPAVAEPVKPEPKKAAPAKKAAAKKAAPAAVEKTEEV